MNLHITDDVIGFGDEQSRRGRTVNSNYFIRVMTVPCQGGAEVMVEAKHGLIFEDGTTAKHLHLRAEHGPRIGERVMMHGRLIKVADKRYGHGGQLMLLDEDTRAWMAWEGD